MNIIIPNTKTSIKYTNTKIDMIELHKLKAVEINPLTSSLIAFKPHDLISTHGENYFLYHSIEYFPSDYYADFD